MLRITPQMCLLLLLPHARAQRSLVSVSECQPDQDEVILEMSLPSNEDGATSICQELCGIQDNCEYWRFDAASLTCSLLSYCYLHSCDSLMAGPEPDLGECLCGSSGTCADLVQENCDPLGSVVWQSDVGEVTGAANCQEFLRVLGPVLGGEVFSYSSLDHTCSILDTGARHCSAVSGPRQPSVEECQAATSTPAPVTTTPAPTSGDGRC